MLVMDYLFLIFMVALAVAWWHRNGAQGRWLVLGLGALAVAMGGAMALHGRWQAVPGLVAVIVVMALWFLRARGRWGSVLVYALLAAGGVAAAVALYALPPFRMSPPLGAYTVGVADFEITDHKRDEPFTDDPNDHRRLAVRVWYPATLADHAKPRPYRTAKEAVVVGRPFARTMGMPGFIFDHLPLGTSHGVVDAPLAAGGKFPVVLFSHGYYGWVDTNTALMEHLASHGYIVLSVSHPYESSAVLYPNGDVVEMASAAQSDRHPPSNMAHMRTLMTSVDPAERFAATHAMYSQSWRLTESASVWRDDFLSVAQTFFAQDVPAPIKPLVAAADGSRRAYVGMSFGGPAAVAACQMDSACGGAVNLDGRDVSLALFDSAVRAPLLMMYQDVPGYTADYRYNDFHYEQVADVGQRPDIYRLIVKGASHWDFTDYTLAGRWPAYPLLFPIAVLGPDRGQRMLALTNEMVAAFLDRHVRGLQHARLDDILGKYPEARRQDLSAIQAWRGGAAGEAR